MEANLTGAKTEQNEKLFGQPLNTPAPDTYVHPDYNPETNKYKGVDVHYIDHPKGGHIDRVELVCEDRFKTSKLSGNEWRFNHSVKFFKKGVLITELHGLNFSDLGSMTQFGAQHPANLYTLDKEIDEAYFRRFNGMFVDYCCHPTCEEKATRIYMLKDRYFDGNSVKDENNGNFSIDARKFCETHGDRGNCGLDDGNSNYIALLGKSPGCDVVIPKEKISKSGGPFIIYVD